MMSNGIPNRKVDPKACRGERLIKHSTGEYNNEDRSKRYSDLI